MKNKAFIITILLILINSLNAKESASYTDEELNLMYKSFLFSKDLKNAYKIAKKAILLNPNSVSWHEKMAEISLWSNHNNEALDQYTWIYKKTDDTKLADKIIKQMLATYQYKKAFPIIKKEIRKKKKLKKTDQIIDISSKIGEPENAIKLLKQQYKKHPSTKYLSDILSLYMIIGEFDGIEEIVKKYENAKDKDIKGSMALSKYYFIKKDLDKAYKALLDIKSKATKEDKEYFIHLSDMGWYLGDYNNAVYASLMLYRSKEARVVDYTRIETMYIKKDIALVKNIAIDAIKNHNNKTIFLSYANEIIDKGDFKTLDKTIQIQLNDKNNSKILKEDPNFWLIKAKVDEHFLREAKVKEDLFKALSLNSKSVAIKKTIIWNLINANQYQEIKKMIEDIEKNKPINKELYHPLSAAYFTIQQPTKAYSYINKSIELEPDNINLLFLKTEILAQQGKIKEKKKELKNILSILTNRSDNDPKLLKDNDFLRAYLQASLEIASHDRFIQLLSGSKKYLTTKDYKELMIADALKQKKYQKAQKIYKTLKKSQPQLEILLAKNNGDLDRAKKLIKKYALGTPPAMQIEIYEDGYEIDDAIKITKKFIKINHEDKTLIEKLNQLHNLYSNKFKANIGYRRRGELRVLDIDLYNFYYLAKGYGIITQIKDFENPSLVLDDKHIKSQRDIELCAGIKKTFKDSSIEVGVNYRNNNKTKVGFVVKAQKSLNIKTNIRASYEKNARILDQNPTLELDGLKDNLNMQLSYAMSKKQAISLSGNYTRFYRSNNQYIGDGTSATLAWNYLLSELNHSGIKVFYSYGDYNQARNTKESLLQKGYNDLGLGLFYGDSTGYYGTKIKPYYDLTGLYSQREKQVYGMAEVGLIGSISEKNYYKIGANYQNAFRGVSKEEFGVKLNYSQLY